MRSTSSSSLTSTFSFIMSTRITADLDTKNQLTIKYYIIKALLIIPQITNIELTPSVKKGYHLIIWTKKNYSLKKQYVLRKKIGDDPARIRLDKIRKFGRQALFQTKVYTRLHHHNIYK